MDDPSSRHDGIAAFEWASNDGVRTEERRVIHVSSLGSFAVTGMERESVALQEITMRPWTRADFVEAVSDEKLRIQVCNTLENVDPLTIEADELVDERQLH